MVEFNSRQWKDRIAEHPIRRRVSPVHGETDLFDFYRAEGAVAVEGTPLSAANMNDLETRIGAFAQDTAAALEGHTADIAGLGEDLQAADESLRQDMARQQATMQARLDGHSADTNNPHHVTAGQIGALPAGGTALNAHRFGGVAAEGYATREALETTRAELEAKLGQTGGDMLKSVYDKNGNGKVDVAELAERAEQATAAAHAATAGHAGTADTATRAGTAAKADNATRADSAARADTATKLATTRTLGVSGVLTGSTSFDGSGNATISTALTNDRLAFSRATIQCANETYLNFAFTGIQYSIAMRVDELAFRPSNTGNGKWAFGSSHLRWGQIYSSNAAISTSDREEKKDIAPFDPALARRLVAALKPSAYKFKDGSSGRTHWGFIAQDLEEAFDDIGITSTDCAAFIKSGKKEDYEDEATGELKTRDLPGYDYALRYEELIAPLVAVVQQQEQRIAKLEAALNSLA